jgi:predicted AlkP superfamily phosphohydrolase/phosphomutase
MPARTIVIGVDGFSAAFAERFCAEGRMPSLGSIARTGAQVNLVTTIPATTPVAWASLITGAPPSVTGIEGFLIHVPGKRLDERISGCYAHRCKAEPLWETAQRAGKRSYVVKFPLSYPSRGASFRLDGAAGWGGLKCLHEVVSTSVADSAGPDPAAISASQRMWSNEPVGPGHVVWRGRWTLENLWGYESVILYLAITEGYFGGAVVTVAPEPDFRKAICELRVGQWSDPVSIFGTGRAGRVECSFRIKVLDASLCPPSLRLFNTALHERTGHSVPDDTWAAILAAAGPIEEQSEPSLVFRSELDLETQLELFRLNVDWLRRVGEYITLYEPWDLIMIHTHVVDWAHHLLQGALDPRHPAYDAATAPRFIEALGSVYALVDDWIGSIGAAAGPGTNLAVVGDHGQDVVHTAIHLNDWLRDEGLLRRLPDGDVDWSHTYVYAAGSYVYINQEGRDECGVVSPSDADRIRNLVIEKLYALVDPRSGVGPVLVAAPKDALEAFGANGPGAGDVVVCFRSGYQATSAPGRVFEPLLPLRAFTSNHDHFWPLDPAIQTRLYAAGPSFRAGYVHPRSEHITDVAATLSAALGIAPPRDSRGRPIDELLSSTAPEPRASVSANVVTA